MNAFVAPIRADMWGVVSISSRTAGECFAAVLTCCFSAFLSSPANAQSPGPGCIPLTDAEFRGDRNAELRKRGGSFERDSKGQHWWCPPAGMDYDPFLTTFPGGPVATFYFGGSAGWAAATP